MGMDLSCRDTGVAVLSIGKEIKLENAISLKTKARKYPIQFAEFEYELHELQKTFLNIQEMIDAYQPDAIVAEFPFFSQSNKAGVMIGMVWGMCAKYFNMENFVAIQPSALKLWSGSKKGDGKEKVKARVLNQVFLLPHQASNDNIVDAVGICLLFNQLFAEA